MARTIKDHTNIYRFKVTTTVTHKRDGYGQVKGQEFTDVKLVGPYTTKIAFQSWIDSSAHVKVERQQLRAVLGPEMIDANTPEELALEWHTIETKYYEPETDDDA